MVSGWVGKQAYGIISTALRKLSSWACIAHVPFQPNLEFHPQKMKHEDRM